MDELPIRIPLGDWSETLLDWLTTYLGGFFGFLGTVFSGAYNLILDGLSLPPWWLGVLLFAALAWWLKGWKLALGTGLGLLVIAFMGQWDNAMMTLALVLVAALVAIVVGLPLGIWAALSPRASAVLRPILDFMQTLPAFVYLIPAVLLFSVGVVPGIVATIIFSLPPAVRFTELGIKGVDQEVVEAGHAFGATRGRILRQTQLPLALPTIMAGVNQVIMLALSMVVTASLVGAPGLGGDVYNALTRLDVGLGAEAGMSIVILAIILDRLTSALTKQPPSLRGSLIAVAVLVAALVASAALRPVVAAQTASGPGAGEEVRIGVHTGWEDGISSAYLVGHILEEQGYRVTYQTAEPGVVYTGLSAGDFDLNMNMWLPLTHAAYLEQYGDELTDLGVWYEDAPLSIAVNEDAPITSIDELAANADAFGNRLVGIEPGAGLTKITQEQVIPEYGLEGMDYLISSTPAMLAEVQSATEKGENIVVTLWHPHWAYDAYPLRDLEDPKGALGEADKIHAVGSPTIDEDLPGVAEIVRNFHLTDEQYASLSNIMFNEMGGSDYPGAVERWLEDNPEYVQSVLDGTAKPAGAEDATPTEGDTAAAPAAREEEFAPAA